MERRLDLRRSGMAAPESVQVRFFPLSTGEFLVGAGRDYNADPSMTRGEIVERVQLDASDHSEVALVTFVRR